MRRLIKRLIDPFLQKIDEWIERELEAAKHDPDISYEEYKDMVKRWNELPASQKKTSGHEKAI
jgi:hypothetical protein